MNTYKIMALIPVTLVYLLTVFKKESENTKTSGADKSVAAISHVGPSTEPTKVSIADVTAIKGDKGQRPVKVMIYLSQATTEPVTVTYNTEDGNAKSGVDYIATKGSVKFEPGEVAKWITVLIIGQVAADPDEGAPVNNVANFLIRLNQAIGAIIESGSANVTIQNITLDPSIMGVGGNKAVYEVIISYTGYTSFFGTAAECGIRPDGVVVLSGLLSGIENVAPDDDIIYTGKLEMIIDIDICSAHRLPGSSEDRLCGIRVDGSGTVFTELEIYFDDTTGTSGRGGYIKIENKDGRFRRVVTGECGEQVDKEWTMVPNKSISSVFNGTELPMLLSRTLHKGTYEETDEQGNKTVVEVLRKLR